MSIKTYKPITPSLRHMIKIIKPKTITKEEKKSISYLIKGRLNKKSGRNNQGRITIRHRGGGHKKLIRIIDRKREKGLYTKYIIERIDYNPITSGFLALCKPLKEDLLIKENKWYILAAEGMKEGDIIEGAEYKNWKKEEIEKKEIKIGESKKLKDIILGTNIYNIDGKLIRAAGTKGILLKNEEKKDGRIESIIKLPSGKIIKIDGEKKACIGQVSNIDHNKQILGKAGVSRWLGWRPVTRGEAMNPVDHPHGGKSHGPGGAGNSPKTKWGKLAKWIKKKMSVT